MTDYSLDHERAEKRKKLKERAKDCAAAVMLMICFYAVITLVDQRDKALDAQEQAEAQMQRMEQQYQEALRLACRKTFCVNL